MKFILKNELTEKHTFTGINGSKVFVCTSKAEILCITVKNHQDLENLFAKKYIEATKQVAKHLNDYEFKWNNTTTTNGKTYYIPTISVRKLNQAGFNISTCEPLNKQLRHSIKDFIFNSENPMDYLSGCDQKTHFNKIEKLKIKYGGYIPLFNYLIKQPQKNYAANFIRHWISCLQGNVFFHPSLLVGLFRSNALGVNYASPNNTTCLAPSEFTFESPGWFWYATFTSSIKVPLDLSQDIVDAVSLGINITSEKEFVKWQLHSQSDEVKKLYLKRKNKVPYQPESSFEWIKVSHPELEKWCDYFKSFIASIYSKDIRSQVSVINYFYEWLITLKHHSKRNTDLAKMWNDISKSPENVDRFKHLLSTPLESAKPHSSFKFFPWLQAEVNSGNCGRTRANKLITTLISFFDWISTQTNNEKCQSLLFSTDKFPLIRGSHSKSVRESIPVKLMNMIKDNLFYNDDWSSWALEQNDWQEVSHYKGKKLTIDRSKKKNLFIDGKERVVYKVSHPFDTWYYSSNIATVKGMTLAEVYKKHSQGYKRHFIFSPARAAYLYTLCTLPLRQDHLNSADSGLLDENIYDPVSETFIENKKGIKGRSIGVFQSFGDIENTFIGFYWANSKTPTSDKDHGFIIKWDNKELRDLLVSLRSINKFIHGVIPLFKRSEYTNAIPSKLMEQLLPKIQPLFIDSVLDPLKPIPLGLSKTRFKDYYLSLLEEVEIQYNKLVDQGEEKPIGAIITKRFTRNMALERSLRSSLRVTLKHSKTIGSENTVSSEKLAILNEKANNHPNINKPLAARWDVHTLRVSGITALAMAGLPVNIIAEFMSGHASLSMNIYYQKIGISHINKLIQEAQNKIKEEPEINSLELFHKDEKLMNEFSLTEKHSDAISIIQVNEPGVWSDQVYKGFICTNGATACDIGGLKTKINGKNTYIPVEGGSMNCPKCRFSLTGPFLLNEQIRASNSLIYDIGEISDKSSQLLSSTSDAMRSGDKSLSRKLIKERQRLELSYASKLRDWIIRLEFIKRSYSKLSKWDQAIILAKEGVSADNILASIKESLPLISNGDESDIKVSFELIDDNKTLMSLITSLGGKVDSLDKVVSADQKIVNRVDNFLKKNGTDPFLFQLSDHEATSAAIEYSLFLAEYHKINFNSSEGIESISFASQLLNGDISLSELDPNDTSFIMNKIKSITAITQPSKLDNRQG